MLSFPDINPIILPLGPLAISWYSLSYVVGILIGWRYAIRVVKANDLGISPKNLDDFVSWVIIGIIIGGRLGYILFYDPAKYFSHPIEILKTYEGGMSFHGGIIGYITAAYLFSKKNNIHFLSLTDISAIVCPVTLMLGRIANFINAELYGRVTDVPWGVVFPGTIEPRHPSQLYEAFCEGLLLIIILGFCANKTSALLKRGLISSLFLIFYSIFRIIIEFFREPDIQIGFIVGDFTMGQLLCLPMLIVGIILMIKTK